MSYWLKILTLYDGSEYSKKAILESIRLAEKFNSKVTVLNVCWEITDAESRSMLKRAEEPLKKSGIRYTLRSVRADGPGNDATGRKVLEILEKEGFDCVVLGARGIGGAKAFLLGSISTKVAAESKCTVILSR
jgi:nucleotide-binding universal stress UspA family protein